jgi:hypothetical protein
MSSGAAPPSGRASSPPLASLRERLERRAQALRAAGGHATDEEDDDDSGSGGSGDESDDDENEAAPSPSPLQATPSPAARRRLSVGTPSAALLAGGDTPARRVGHNSGSGSACACVRMQVTRRVNVASRFHRCRACSAAARALRPRSAQKSYTEASLRTKMRRPRSPPRTSATRGGGASGGGATPAGGSFVVRRRTAPAALPPAPPAPLPSGGMLGRAVAAAAALSARVRQQLSPAGYAAADARSDDDDASAAAPAPLPPPPPPPPPADASAMAPRALTFDTSQVRHQRAHDACAHTRTCDDAKLSARMRAQSFFFGGVGDAPSESDSPPPYSPPDASPDALPPLASPTHDAPAPSRRERGFSMGGGAMMGTGAAAAALMMSERPRRASLSERAPGAYREPSLVTKMRRRSGSE